MDLSKLSKSDQLVAGGGLVLFIASFLPWFKVEVFGFSETGNGWDVGFFWGGIPALLGLAAAAAVLANKLKDVELPELPISWGQAFLAAGAVSAAIVVLKLIIGEDPSEVVDRSWGLFLATIAALAFAAGGYLKFQEDGGTATSGTDPTL